jgi:hypothetical protein
MDRRELTLRRKPRETYLQIPVTRFSASFLLQ